MLQGEVGRIMRQVGTLVAFGAGAGLIAAMLLAKFVSTLLYDVQSHDLLSVAAAVLIVAAAGLGAGWLQARRASHVEAAEVLRTE